MQACPPLAREASPTFQLGSLLLFGGCRYVYVNLLITAEHSPTKYEQSSYDYDHKDHKHGHHSCTSCTTVVSHKFPPLQVGSAGPTTIGSPPGRFATEQS